MVRARQQGPKAWKPKSLQKAAVGAGLPVLAYREPVGSRSDPPTLQKIARLHSPCKQKREWIQKVAEIGPPGNGEPLRLPRTGSAGAGVRPQAWKPNLVHLEGEPEGPSSRTGMHHPPLPLDHLPYKIP